jgi:hypothetical protein
VGNVVSDEQGLAIGRFEYFSLTHSEKEKLTND